MEHVEQSKSYGGNTWADRDVKKIIDTKTISNLKEYAKKFSIERLYL